MFERFTDQSRRAVVLAQQEAARLDHHHVGTEHVLAGLVREERGTAGRVLRSADITVQTLLSSIEDRLSAIERHLGMNPGGSAG
jgi:ATP-dependent Clp protease ATP-binding subunit ClpA